MRSEERRVGEVGLSRTFASPVARCRRIGETVTSVAAFTTVTPGVVEVIWTVHSPLTSIVVQVVLTRTKVAGPLAFEKVISVPAGALTKPVPSFTLTWPVRVWLVPIALFAFAGVIWM